MAYQVVPQHKKHQQAALQLIRGEVHIVRYCKEKVRSDSVIRPSLTYHVHVYHHDMEAKGKLL